MPTNARFDDWTLPELQLDLDRHDQWPLKLKLELPAPWISSVLEKGSIELGDDGGPRGHAGSFGVEIDKVGGKTVIVRGDVEAKFWVACGRCLSPAEIDASASICVTFMQRDSSQLPDVDDSSDDPDGIALSNDDLDVAFFDGHNLDLNGFVAEQLLVAIPIRALCEKGEQCQGLCGSCGKDLNQLDAEELSSDGRCAVCVAEEEAEEGSVSSGGKGSSNSTNSSWGRALAEWQKKKN